jgi:hypothetical protein
VPAIFTISDFIRLHSVMSQNIVILSHCYEKVKFHIFLFCLCHFMVHKGRPCISSIVSLSASVV